MIVRVEPKDWNMYTVLLFFEKDDPHTEDDAVREYRRASKADETKRAFAKNWKAFEGWCQAAGAVAFPCLPQVLEAYLVHLAERGLRTASIEQACWAVDTAHRTAGRPAPGASEQVRVVLAGIRRTIGRPQHRKAALTIEHLRRIPFRDDLIGRRDKLVEHFETLIEQKGERLVLY